MYGYFKIYNSNESKYAGGLLVLNNKGIPESFRYTTPIKPNKIQKIIYGNNIKGYLSSQILAKGNILENENVEIIFVEEEELLDFIDIEIPLAFLKYSTGSKETKLKENEGIISKGENDLLRLYFSKEISQELFYKMKEDVELFDFVEPFDRLKQALSHVCSSEENI